MRLACVLEVLSPSSVLSLTLIVLQLNAVQLPPFPDQVSEYGKFAGRVAAQFKGRVKAYEIWYRI